MIAARLDCKVQYRGHRHGQSCWTAKPEGTTHHANVWSEGRDWQCTCGSWGAAEPGHLGYEMHIEEVLRVTEQAANDLLRIIGSLDLRIRTPHVGEIEDIRQRLARAF